jgi:hypothetical protein
MLAEKLDYAGGEDVDEEATDASPKRLTGPSPGLSSDIMNGSDQMGFLHGTVAFWGGDACEKLHIPSDGHGSRIACDARSGACNPYCPR